ADRNRSHWSTSKTPSYTKSVSWHHYPFFSINAISREIYHQSLMCDFLFIVEPGLFIIGLNKVNG
ncbi:hypothetical protein, partial [Escherichia coli]|uniref:hypothetical protein n=1 Tax=Escherichia coli TaxID=562 RepID=UPI001FF2E416